MDRRAFISAAAAGNDGLPALVAELVANLNVENALRLTIPRSLLLRADEAIQ